MLSTASRSALTVCLVFYAGDSAAGGFAGSRVWLVNPALMRTGHSQHVTHETSLVVVVATGAAGLTMFDSHGSVDFEAVAMLAASGTVTARHGAQVSSALSPPKLALTEVFMVIMAPT